MFSTKVSRDTDFRENDVIAIEVEGATEPWISYITDGRSTILGHFGSSALILL